MEIAIVIILCLVAGLNNGQMDYIKKNNLDMESWKNKWNMKFPLILSRKDQYRPWYYFGLYRSKYKEKFPFSSTIFVFTTDAWHFHKWCMFLCFETSLMVLLTNDILYISIGIIALKFIRGVTFNFMYEKV